MYYSDHPPSEGVSCVHCLVSVSSSAVPGMTVAPGQAKVLVAKMPTIPPQLLGAQPSTGLSKALEEDRLPGIKNCYQTGIYTGPFL